MVEFCGWDLSFVCARNAATYYGSNVVVIYFFLLYLTFKLTTDRREGARRPVVRVCDVYR